MNRRLIVAFALVASLLLVSMPTAVVATQGSAKLVVGAQQTTANDFQSGTLTNFSTTGSGSIIAEGSNEPASITHQWHFDETSGSTAADAVGNDTGTIHGGVTLGVSGHRQTAYSFDGSTGYVSTGTTLPAGSMSIGAWVYKPSGTSDNEYIAGSQNSNSGGGRFLRFSNTGTNIVNFEVTNDNNVIFDAYSSSGISSGTYHYVVGVLDTANNEIRLYVDGNIVDTTPVSGSFSTQLSDFKIGRRPDTSSSWFSGRIDEPSVYAGALTENQVSKIYSSYTNFGMPATYVSGPMSVDNASAAAINITKATNVSATLTAQAYIGGSWTTESSKTVTSTGNKTLSLPKVSASSWRVRVRVTGNGSSTVFELADVSILFTDQAPVVTSPTPTGTIHTSMPTLSANVSDPTFGTAQGDSVALDWYVDGGKVATTSASINGTYTLTTSALSDGNHSWYVVATDAYGASTTLAAQSIDIQHFAPTATADSPNGTTSHYQSNTLTADVSDQDFAYQGDNVTINWYVDGSKVSSSTATSNGTYTYTTSALGDGSHTWHVELADSYGKTGSSGTASWTIQHFAPSVANLSPADGSLLTSRSTTFTADISDQDFAFDGDHVNASLFVDGAYVGHDTLTTNGTASVSTTIASGGSHTYHWELSDDYGYSASSANLSLQVPSNLYIYNESNPTQLVTNASIEIRMYANETGTPQIYNRTTTSGTINMTGIPPGQPFVVVADAANYTSRRIFVPSLYDVQRIYLLPNAETSVKTIFALKDYTGKFPKDRSVLLVQRALNGSYQTVLGDYFGATGQFPGILRYQARHLLVLYNVQTGDRRVVGTFTPLTSSTQTVIVSPKGIARMNGHPPTIAVSPALHRLPAVSNASFGVSVTSPSNNTSVASWSATAWLRSANGTKSKVWTYSASSEGSTSGTADLSGAANKTLLLNVTWVTQGGLSVTKSYTIAITPTFSQSTSFLGSIAALAQLSPPGARGTFKTFIAMIITIFGMAGTASKLRSGMIGGMTGLLILTAFSAIGWIGYDLVFVAGVGFFAMAAIRRGL